LAAAFVAFAGHAAVAAVIEVLNDSGRIIEHFQVSPVSTEQWGPDWLGNKVIPPGYKFTMEINPGYYDLRVVAKDGATCVIRNAGLEGKEVWTLTAAYTAC
jgi:hypothetical protein